ncbi:MAG TPA: ComF family protein [Thermoleophilaceae bacterium]|jgi:ComF family protein
MPLARLLSLVAPPLCVCCGAAAPLHQPLCRTCLGDLRWLAFEQPHGAGVPVWAAVSYEGPARALVRAVKFRGAVGLVDALAAQMAANAPPGLLAGRTLVPVPLHPARRRRRGFNQAEELAKALSRRAGLVAAGCLERTAGGARATQVGMGRAERLGALDGSIRMRVGAAVPLRALLVDDVVTTGSTLAACAGVLAGAGVREVEAIVYARTPGR